MKTKRTRTLTALSLGATLALAAGCATTSPYAAAPMKEATTGAPAGEKLREARVEGYQFAYYLLDVGETAAPKTKHLMVFVTAPDGKEVADAEVTYRIAGPGTGDRTVTAYRLKGGTFTYTVGPERRTVASIPMAGGYGADLPLRDPGDYTLTVKVAVGATGLNDEFGYTAK